MPAYFDTGFSVRQPMWHGQGIVLDDYPRDWADARDKAGLLWEPTVRPAFVQARYPEAIEAPMADAIPLHPGTRQGTDVVTSTEWMNPLPDHKLIVRDDTEAVLGVVGEGYELVGHGEMGEIVDALLGEGAKFETAGSCRGGAQVWALAYLDEPYTVAGDDTETLPFLAVLNSHDGSGACKVVATQVRVVCWNTYRAAEMQGERTGQQFTFRHTSGVHDRIAEAKAALAGVRDEAKAWDAMTVELFGMKADSQALDLFVADFIPEPPADVVSPRVRSNIDTARSIFRKLYLDGPTTEAHRGTALGLVDTAVEYLDHVRGFRNRDTYLGRTLLRPEPLKAKATTLAREVCSR